ncbi:three-Cys-motif partner protein TcmP [Mycobacteroides abscessus]|nr:three-Cys-motif partner protein TcmP [Mycobacteroides abscessus]
MTSNDEFFQRQQPAAVLKHSVLEEYCNVFTSMVGSAFKGPIWLIDGYAGPGWYQSDDNTARVPGSPIVAARLAQRWRTTGKRDLRCIFIEANPAYFCSLREGLTEFAQDSAILVPLNGEVQERLDEAWKCVNGAPTITFLDPFGIAMPNHLVTDVLLSRTRQQAPSEVLLNINLEAVWRLGGCLQERDGQIVAKTRQEKGVERVDRVFGDIWWRREFYEARNANGASAAAAATAVVEQYRRRITDATGCLSISIPVRRRHGNPPLFHLTLFYRHPVAGYKFADAARRATRKWRDTFRAKELADATLPVEGTLFDLTEQIQESREKEAAAQERAFADSWIAVISANIKELVAEHRVLPVAENVVPILGATLSLAGEPELRRAWDQLSETGIVLPRNKSKALYQQSLCATP